MKLSSHIGGVTPQIPCCQHESPKSFTMKSEIPGFWKPYETIIFKGLLLLVLGSVFRGLFYPVIFGDYFFWIWDCHDADGTKH